MDASAQTPPRERPATVRGARIRGIDAARALAVIGMVMVHIGPTSRDDPAGVAGTLYTAPHGRASILFVLLAGVGVTLLFRGRSADRPGRAWARIGVRVAVLAPLGLALQLLDHGVLVILQYYALYFVVAAAASHLGDRAVLTLAGIAALAGPVIYLAAWHAQPAWFATDAVTLTDPPGVIALELVLSGSYPAVTWSAPLLFGVWLGRHDLRDPAVGIRLIVGGAAVAIGAWLVAHGLVAWLGAPVAEPSWWELIVDDPHSQMPMWLLGATGSAALVLGLCLRVADLLPRPLWPLAATGQLALTVYVGHLLVLAACPDLLQRDTVGPAVTSVAAFTAVVVALSTAWRAVLPYGPLEAAFQLPRAARR